MGKVPADAIRFDTYEYYSASVTRNSNTESPWPKSRRLMLRCRSAPLFRLFSASRPVWTIPGELRRLRTNAAGYREAEPYVKEGYIVSPPTPRETQPPEQREEVPAFDFIAAGGRGQDMLAPNHRPSVGSLGASLSSSLSSENEWKE